MKLTLSTNLLPSLPLEDCLEVARELGFPAVAVGGHHLPASAPDEVVLAAFGQAAVEGVDVAIWDPGIGRFAENKDSEAAFRKALRLARLAAECPDLQLIIHPSRRPESPQELFGWMQSEGQTIQRLFDSVEDARLSACVPITPQTIAADPFTASGLLQWVDRLDARLLFDAVELSLARMDSSEKALRAVEDRVGAFLLRDFNFEEGTAVDCPFLEGVTNLRPHLERLNHLSFDGPLILGSHLSVGVREDPLAVAAKEMASGKALLQELGLT